MLGAQNPADNQLWNGARVALGTTVAPGQQYTFSFPFTAPAPGSYSMQWKMLRASVEWFGATSSSPVTVAAAQGSDVVTYIHTDALGSPVARTDAAGNIISRTRYEPYGGTASGVTPTIGFTGHVNDADTSLVYMQQRYYDPVAGRFLSIDPVTTDANTGGSFNRYAYAKNSPYKYLDPDGRDVAMVIFRETFTNESVTGTISVHGSSGARFTGSTLENAHAGDKHDKPPIRQGEYDAEMRTDHSPNRVELKDVAGYSNVQIHVGNTAKDVKGCFAVGTSSGTNSVSGSKPAMNSILDIIKNDGGPITVTVIDPPKPNEKPVQNLK